MLTEKDLNSLIDLRPKYPVLSVFINLERASGSLDEARLQLRQMLKPFEKTAAEDCEAIMGFIQHEFDGAGRSLAIFSCQADAFFRTYAFSIPLRSRARRLNRPYVKPLVDLFDSYGNYGVALVDKQGARLFHFHLGDLREQEGTLGEVVRHTKRGGGSQAAGRRGGTAGQTRYAEEVAERNVRDAAQFAARFFKDNRVRRVLIGGTEANVARFIEALPKTWRSLVMGSFPIEMTANHAHVLEKAMEVAQSTEQDRETRLIDAVVTAAAKGREGVVRLDDTLGAVHAGNVQTLVISEGFRAPGYQCLGCNYLTAQKLSQCPFCAGTIAKIEDAVELAVHKVLSDGGEVEVLRNNPELEKAGRIGALLRY